MADDSANLTRSEPREYKLVTITEELDPAKHIAQLKRELELVKHANPFRMAEIAIELEIEKLRVVEIAKARDTALQHLSECYISIHQKNAIIEEMQSELDRKGDLPMKSRTNDTVDLAAHEQLKTHISMLETSNEELRLTVAQLKASAALDLPPSYESNDKKSNVVDAGVQTEEREDTRLSQAETSEIEYVLRKTDGPQELVNARNAKLVSIPLPDDPPDVTLTAIVIPAPFTLHEFLNGAPASLKTALSNYKVLYDITTCWCPEREEHGYIYVPMFKCSTNPRIATAHRWLTADVIGRMNKPTECFYNKEGVWYYAGSYKAFIMDQLSTKEWAQLPPESVSAIVKETLVGRKNISPQNTYETTQLYAVGALRVACVGLHCVGFDQEIYKSILEHAGKFSESKWKSLATASAKVLPAATPSEANINSTSNVSKEVQTMPTPGLVKTPIIGRHSSRTSGLLSSSTSTTGSPLASRSNIYAKSHATVSPQLGLGFGSSTWNMWANDRSGTSSSVSLVVPMSGVPPPVEAKQNSEAT